MINDPVIPDALASPPFLSNVSVPVLFFAGCPKSFSTKTGARHTIVDECLSSCVHFCCKSQNPPPRSAFTSIAPVQRICSRSSNSLCLCIEYTSSLPLARMCCACAAFLNSRNRVIIGAQAAANRAALLQRLRSDRKTLNPKTAFTPTIMPCHNRYEPMRAVQNRCTGTTHSGPL